MKHLYRSKENRICKGVLGGIGEYIDVDPTLIRLLWVFVFLATGIVPGLLAYIIAIFIVPEKTSS